MKCGKLTAKLRDAVPVRFYENGKEIKRYKNIEIPDAIKELEFTGFKFDVPESGPITFKIFFKPGTLPETWPEVRQRKSRMPKAADPETIAEDAAQDTPEIPQETTEPMAEEIPQEMVEADEDAITDAEADPQDEPVPEAMTVQFDVTGSARKALAHAIGEGIGAYPAYEAAPSFAYTIGEYTLDRHGVLTGPHNANLLGYLAEDGYTAK